MKYIAIVCLFMATSLSEVASIRIDGEKPTSEESASAEADIDALMDKYDDKE